MGRPIFGNPPKNANPWAVAKMASPRYFTSQVHFRILRLFVALVWGRCTCLLDADNFFCTFFCVVAAFFASFWGCDFCCCGFRVTALLLLCFFMSCFESLVLGGYQLECAHFFWPYFAFFTRSFVHLTFVCVHYVCLFVCLFVVFVCLLFLLFIPVFAFAFDLVLTLFCFFWFAHTHIIIDTHT